MTVTRWHADNPQVLSKKEQLKAFFAQWEPKVIEEYYDPEVQHQVKVFEPRPAMGQFR